MYSTKCTLHSNKIINKIKNWKYFNNKKYNFLLIIYLNASAELTHGAEEIYLWNI